MTSLLLKTIVTSLLIGGLVVPSSVFAQNMPGGGTLNSVGTAVKPTVEQDSAIFLTAGDIAEGVPRFAKSQHDQWNKERQQELDRRDPSRITRRKANNFAKRFAKIMFPFAAVIDTGVRMGKRLDKEEEDKFTGSERTGAVLRWVIQEFPNAQKVVAPLGDLAYKSGTVSDFLHKYDPTWGKKFENNTVIRPAPGNHEYWVEGGIDARGAQHGLPYGQYFNDIGVKVGDIGPFTMTDEDGKGKPKQYNQFLNNAYYAYDIGKDWRVYSLNSVCAAMEDGCTENSKQVKWLAEDLAKNARDKCIIATMHHPRFSSMEDEYAFGIKGEKGAKGAFNFAKKLGIKEGELIYQAHGSNVELDPMWRTLYAAGTDMVIAGHAHVYERLSPMGITPRPITETEDDKKNKPKNEAERQARLAREALLRPYQVEENTGIRQFIVGTGGGELSKYNNHKLIEGSEFRIPDRSKEIKPKFGVLMLELRNDSYNWQFLSVDTDANGNPYVYDKSNSPVQCHKKRNSDAVVPISNTVITPQPVTSPSPVASSVASVSPSPVSSPVVSPTPTPNSNPSPAPSAVTVTFSVNGKEVTQGSQPGAPGNTSYLQTEVNGAAGKKIIIKVYDANNAVYATKEVDPSGVLLLPALAKLRYVVEVDGKAIREIKFP